MTSHVQIPIRVIDENDCSPRFLQESYTATITENNDVGAFVLEVVAIDDDVDGKNSEITYSVHASHDEHAVQTTAVDCMLKIDARTGRITTNGVFDRESIVHHR